jgi:hypothetical protein
MPFDKSTKSMHLRQVGATALVCHVCQSLHAPALTVTFSGIASAPQITGWLASDGSRTLRQEQEETEWLRLKVYKDTGFAKFTRGRIQLEGAEGEIRQVGQVGWNCDHKLTENVGCREFYQFHEK